MMSVFAAPGFWLAVVAVGAAAIVAVAAVAARRNRQDPWSQPEPTVPFDWTDTDPDEAGYVDGAVEYREGRS